MANRYMMGGELHPFPEAFPKYWYTGSHSDILDYIENLNGKRYNTHYLGYTGNYCKEFKGFNGSNEKPNLKYEDGWNRKEMTYVTFDEWKAEFVKDESELPKDWCLKLTDDNLEYISKIRYISIKNETGYITSNLINNKWNFWRYTREPFGNEITFEQFRKYVMKEESKEEIINNYEIF